MSYRLAQIESELKRAISQVLERRLGDPRIRGMISITRVEATADLSKADVYISVLPSRHQNLTLAGLRHATPRVYRQVCELVQMKRVPKLEFHLDLSLKKQARVYRAIARGMAKEAQKAQESTEGGKPGIEGGNEPVKQEE